MDRIFFLIALAQGTKSGEDSFFFFNKFIYLFRVALGLCCCSQAFSSCESGDYSSLQCAGFSLWWLLFVAEHRL